MSQNSFVFSILPANCRALSRTAGSDVFNDFVLLANHCAMCVYSHRSVRVNSVLQCLNANLS